jgi:hypothetical protein
MTQYPRSNHDQEQIEVIFHQKVRELTQKVTQDKHRITYV